MTEPVHRLDGRSVGVTVCPNGIGHAVRALRVLRVLVDEHGPAGRVVVTLTRDQLAALHPEVRDWLVAREARILHDVVEPGVGLPGSMDAFADGRLQGWVARWAGSEAARTDLVVSDNLTGVLDARPDAVLMGSFLWSDVLGAVANGPAVDAFVADERALLAAHRPPMLATADVVHPGVVARTAVVPLPWPADRPRPTPDGTGDAIAMLGGRTGAAADRLGRVAGALRAAGREVVTDPSVLDGPGRGRIGLLVCRPGLGTVTAGVVGSIPMLLVSEPGNPELDHTASALVVLGLARTLDATAETDTDPAAVLAAVAAMEDDAVRTSMRAALGARPTGGHRVAAGWLARYAVGGRDAVEGEGTTW